MSKKTISLEDAKAWTKSYQNNMPKGSAKAFLISSDVLIALLKEMKVLQDAGKGTYTLNNIDNSAIRAYMAVNPKQKEANGQTLAIVGTKKDAKGVARDMVEGVKSKLFSKSDLDDSGIFDFVKPCPDHCDQDSPLNHQ